MRTALAVVLLGMVVALSGCDFEFIVPSLHPFYIDEDVVFDPALVGSWEQQRDEARTPAPGPLPVWTFRRGDGSDDSEAGAYDLTVSVGDYEASFEAHLAKIGDALFLDLLPGDLQTPQFRPGADEPRSPEEDAGDEVMLLYFLHCLPTHSVWRVRLTGDGLRLDPLDVDWVAGEVREERLGLRYEEVSSREVLTASRAELRQFLAQHSQDDKAFAGGFTYARQNSPRPEPEQEKPAPPRADAPAEPSARAPGPVLDQRLTFGDITISYPKGLESQAKELAEVCQQVIPARRERYLAAARAFSDDKAMAQHVVDLLGCPDQTDMACRLVSAVGSSVDTLAEALFLPMFSDVRIYREADLKTLGGLHTAVVDLTYDPNADLFTFQIASQVTGEGIGAPAGQSFMPLAVRDDGTFRTRAGLGLAESISGLLDELAVESTITMRAAAIHEAAEVLVVGLGCDHPFARWFNEGVANWVALQVVAQVAPEYLQLCREHFLPRREADPLRERINLLAWTQVSYGREFVVVGDTGLDEAHYPYATELIERLLQGQPAGALAEVVARVKGSQSPDTDAICQAFQEVTGKAARSMLLEYVPAHVRDSLTQGLAGTKLQEGYAALSAGQLPQAAARLKEALEMSPSDADAHLNLAIVMRRSLQGSQAPSPGTEQRRWQESQRHIAIAAALTTRDPSRQFQIHGSVDDEALYALGRAEQFRGRIKEAKDILSQLPQDDEDAREALKEIAEQEKAPAPRPAGGGRQE